jgi:Ca2+-transporting ATPase
VLLGPVHIAFLQMVIDPVSSLVFEAEPEEKDVMRRPPRDPQAPLFSPGLLAWARSGYTGGKSGKAVVEAFAESFNTTKAMALALITGEINYTVDGDEVVFDWFGSLDTREGE